MYAVAGASGRIGAIVAETLLDWGLPLRVVVTSANRGARWMARGADVAVADVTDASTRISFFGKAWSEPVLIRLAYAFEQATGHRKAPSFRETL